MVMIKTEPHYKDSLIEIRNDGILFKRYSFFWRSRFVSYDDIEKVFVLKATILTGKWRLHGTGDFQYWFPADFKRYKRDAIFIAYIRGKRMDIGFTAEDSSRVIDILRQKQLIDDADIGLDGTSEIDLRTKRHGWILFLGILAFTFFIIPSP